MFNVLLSLVMGAGTTMAQEMPDSIVPTALPPITISDNPVIVSQMADDETNPQKADAVEMMKLMLGLTGHSEKLITNNTDDELIVHFLLPEGFTVKDNATSEVTIPPRHTMQVNFTYTLSTPPTDRKLVVVEETATAIIGESSYRNEFGIVGVYADMSGAHPMMLPAR